MNGIRKQRDISTYKVVLKAHQKIWVEKHYTIPHIWRLDVIGQETLLANMDVSYMAQPTNSAQLGVWIVNGFNPLITSTEIRFFSLLF